MLVDSGAHGNFISHQMVMKYDIPWRLKERPYELITVDGAPTTFGQGWIKMETQPLILKCQQHHEWICLDITDTARHAAILGNPWLMEHNPTIN